MKLVPAIIYKDKIENYIRSIYYSDDSYLMSGFNHSFNEVIEDDKDGTLFQWAILSNSNQLMGFVSYKINWYDAILKKLKLLSFVEGNVCIKFAMQAIVDKINSYNLHKMTFWCIDEDPMLQKYINFTKNNNGQVIILQDEFRDHYGKYHNLYRFDIMLDKDLVFDTTNYDIKNKVEGV